MTETIGMNIKIARLNAGMTQTDLADAIGFHRVSIANIEDGRNNTTINRLEQIADVLGVPFTQLLKGL